MEQTIEEKIEDAGNENLEKELEKAIKQSMSQKKERFLKEMEENPNKRLYTSKITIKWVDLIDVDKNELRYEENFEDYKFNNSVMSAKTKNFNLELLKFASIIQSFDNVSIEELSYKGRPYETECPKNSKEVKKALHKLLSGISPCFKGNCSED